MPKERSNCVSSSHKSRTCSPYRLNDQHPDIGKSLSNDDLKDAKCPICLDPPHNAVLILCSSYESGCRPFMCDTSYRHSNCLDQYKKMHKTLDLVPIAFSSEVPDERSHLHGNHLDAEVAMSQATPTNEESSLDDCMEPSGQVNLSGHEIPQLICPLCRGEVKGFTVVEQVRKYLNTKGRSCAHESCPVVGNYSQLRKHARSEHPSVRPTEVDPARQRDWNRLEQERNMNDVISSLRSAIPGATVLGDYIVEDHGREGFYLDTWWTFLLLVRSLDPHARITITQAIPAQVNVRANDRSGRRSDAQGNVFSSNSTHNGRLGRGSDSSQDDDSGSSATGTSRLPSNRRHSGGHSSQ